MADNAINIAKPAKLEDTAEIKFNPNKFNRSRLDIFKTMIHELIHAEIFRKLLSCAGLPHVNYNSYTSQQWENFLVSLMNSYPGLHDYFVRYFLNTGTLTDYHHEMMAQHYIDVISDALSEFDNNSSTPNLYNDLAWTGLMGDGLINMSTGLPSEYSTVAWLNLTSTERIQILNNYFNHLNSSLPCQ